MTPTTETAPPNVVAELVQRIEALEKKAEDTANTSALSMVVFSGELDKLLAAFMIATGAAACGMKVSMFFTFWGTAALKKPGRQRPGKDFVEKMFGWMLRGGFHKRKLSRLDMAGLGRRIMTRQMEKKGVASLPELIDAAREADVEIYVCQTSMLLMGIHREELIDYPNMRLAGAARFLETASAANTTLFI